MHKETRAFTLIELLVVIAIIGILAAVILAALGTAKQRGNTSAIQSDLQSIRNQAEIYATANANSYGSASGSSCNTGMYADPTILAAITNVQKNNGNVSLVCNSTAGAYAVQSPLISGGYWCVDGSGNSHQDTTQLGSGVIICP